MSDIPVARELLLDVAKDLNKLEHVKEADRIRKIVYNLMMKEVKRPRTKQKSVKFTPTIAARIRKTKKKSPHLSNQELADLHNVNPGRVSDALDWKK